MHANMVGTLTVDKVIVKDGREIFLRKGGWVALYESVKKVLEVKTLFERILNEILLCEI